MAQHRIVHPGTVLPSDEVIASVRTLIERVGINAAAARLESSRESVARIAGGIGVRRATAECVQSRLAEALRASAPEPSK